MEFNLNKSIEVLSNTPDVIAALFEGLSSDWLHGNEGPDTWSPYLVLAHLVHGEKTDWPGRIRIILIEDDKKFIPFDRAAHLGETKPVDDLVDEFRELRDKNLQALLDYNLTEEMLNMQGIHPAFGNVTLKQLLSTWVAHDLGHIAQMTRVMAKQYKEEAGPWIEYLTVLKR
jgi:hypothetical protein